MPNTIKVKRGKSAALNSSTEKLQAGEVLYNLDKNYLTVGAKDNDALTKKPVAAREIVGYAGDTNDKIGASTTEAYSIRYDDDSGVVVSSENNILSTPGTLKMQTPGKNASTITIRTGEVDPDGSAKPTIELSTSLSMPLTLALPWKTGTLATTDDITASIATKLDNTNEDKVALKNNESLSYTSDAAAYTIMSRDANGRARVADGAGDQDIATVGQLNTGLNTKYTKPESGIPKTDLASSVQTSLAKADSALQSHQTVKLESGTNNGTLKLTVNGTATDNIAVTNLGSAAFTAASNYATAADLGNYYNKTESDGRYVKSSENFVKAFTIPNGASSGTLTADVKEKLCNPDGHNYYVYDTTSEMILKYSFNEDDEIIQYKAIYIQSSDKAYDITMQILPSNGTWRRSQTILKGVTANPTLTGTEDELTGLKVGGTDYKISVTKEYVDDGFVRKVTGSSQVYSKGSDGVDGSIGYSQSPANSAITQYSSSGTLRTNTPTADLDAVNMSYGESNYYQLDKGIYLPENADLNNYKAPGTYKANPQVAGTVVNAPKGSSFFTLFISTNPGTEVITQLLYSYSHIFTRSYATSWSDWEELATKTDLKDYYILNGGTYTTEGGTTTDFNTLTTPGVYDIGPGEKVNGPLDSGAPVRLVVETFYKSDTIIFQTFISYDVEFTNTNCQYHRMYRGATEGWGEWHQVATTDYVNNGFVKSVADTVNQYSVYAIGKNKDITITLAENPDAQAVVQYSSAGTLKTNNPTATLDAVNKQYGESHYYNLDVINFIGDEADLNTLTTVGNYGFGPTTSVHNGPDGYSGGTPTKFIVEGLYNNGWIIKQTLISNENQKSIIYTRTGLKENMDQYPWIQMADTSYVDNKKVFSVTIYEAGD